MGETCREKSLYFWQIAFDDHGTGAGTVSDVLFTWNTSLGK